MRMVELNEVAGTTTKLTESMNGPHSAKRTLARW
eukprot:CAMPEP_0119530008 /NCGR_PEP_ID=MMETSP1344-20130328/43903_1 /TAXON_ID=236787 /ORGANISM="Florenciella parvula, Strain CCMP2471" /LENGTH=33 /DNA_ID= /DNA_START= /DNA_END= /DNA_ORIENTATION=